MRNNCIIANGIKWYCYSIFYNRKQWLNLLCYLKDFYLHYKNILCFFYYRFSDMNGEHLELIMTFNTDNINTNDIDAYFNIFLKDNPSSNDHEKEWISYSIWMHYSNNSTIWNRIHIPEIILEDSSMRQNLFSASVIGMYIGNLVSDIESVLLFLIVRLLKEPILKKNDIFHDMNINYNVKGTINTDFLDIYLSYHSDMPDLEKLLQDWDELNKKNYKQENYFLNMYVMIREQYATGKEKNKLLSDVINKYFYDKIKE